MNKNINCIDHKYDLRLYNKLPYFLDQVLIGLCLGDLHIGKSGSVNSNTRFSLTMAGKYTNLAIYIYCLFNHFINPKGFRYSKVKSGLNSKLFSRIQLISVALPIFNYYHNLFYNNIEGKYVKIVPLNIENLLSDISLAFLIMSDGNYNKVKKVIRLCTNNFTKSEVELLSKAIYKKFGIVNRIEKVRKEQYILVIKTSEVVKLQNLVKSHIHYSMLYRIGL